MLYAKGYGIRCEYTGLTPSQLVPTPTEKGGNDEHGQMTRDPIEPDLNFLVICT